MVGGRQAAPGVAHLLDGLFGGGSTSTTGGIGGIISAIMELINNLLSGLFGGQVAPAPAA